MISLKRLRDFWSRHPDAETALRQWYKQALHARWQSLQELRADLPQADGVTNQRGETLTVFNIGGNKYRLIARVRYDYQLINIREVLTHADYDKGKWKD
ncbi:MAG: type II toxin-antitoxin system HigB family toxin [Phycisphaeraceae bacterium]